MRLEQEYSLLKKIAFFIVMPAFIDFFNVIVNQYRLGSTSTITMLFYLFSLITILYCSIFYNTKEQLFNNTIVLLLSYSPFACNYLLFPGTREYMVMPQMTIVYIFVFPICVFGVRKIENWELITKALLSFSWIAILCGFALVMFLDSRTYLNYMDFSYAMLPSIIVEYKASRDKIESRKRTLHVLLFGVGILEIIIFGARAPILFTLCFILAYELLSNNVPKNKKLLFSIVMIFLILVIQVFGGSILHDISKLSILGDSRILAKLSSGELTASAGRERINIKVEEYLKTVGVSVSGMFGERDYLGIYPHNIAFELIMTFGWGIGLGLIGALLYLIVKSMFLKEEKKIVFIFLFLSLFTRYLISGSYLQEGKFWIFLFSMITMLKVNKQNE